MTTKFKTFIKEVKKGEKTYQFVYLWCYDTTHPTQERVPVFYQLKNTPSKETFKLIKDLAKNKGYIDLEEKDIVKYVQQVEVNDKLYLNHYIDIKIDLGV